MRGSTTPGRLLAILRVVLPAILLVVVGMQLACGGPVGPIPGGRLAGEEVPYPEDGFAGFRDLPHVDLELRPGSPRSVRTWVVVLDDKLFVPADFFNPGKRWPEQALADPRVRVRLGDVVVQGRLVRVEGPDLHARLRLETARKYDVAPDSWAARIEVWWFRLEPRADEPGL